MDGRLVKEKLKKCGVPLSEIAARLGYENDQRLHSQLKSNDVKTGLLEQICTAIGVGMSFFYPDNENNAIASGDFSAASVHGDATVGATADVAVLQERVKSLEQLVAEKERLIKVLMDKK